MHSQESSQDEIIKNNKEQWRWSEMQGLELNSSSNQNNLDPLSEEDKEASNMETEVPNGNKKDGVKIYLTSKLEGN